ncbi:hypothetical protein C9890_0096 [Perkinsus sp. BL_2016]|nr:hypothetical protein C9890_0096 [Perkinsus sp. BL_2016]
MFHGDTVQVLTSLHGICKFQHIFCNRDFTVFAQERDRKIHEWCRKNSVTYVDCEDYDIVPSDRVLMNEGAPEARPYTVLSHYFNKFTKDVYTNKALARRPVSESISTSTFFRESLQMENYSLYNKDDLSKLYTKKTTLIQQGGRAHGLSSLSRVDSVWQKYSNDRHYPGKQEATTRMSAHLKFGTVSIREFFYKVVDASGGSLQSDLLREVVFRSFYYKIWTHRPTLQRDVSFHQHIDDQIPWRYPKDSAKDWEAWTLGMTGFPMADAGMRQLEVEGYVHGRPRMVLATVATRYLLFDWRECARFFATKLTDYDPILNAAGWGFGSSLGENAQNVWRAPMNPLLQSRNYDPECEYIKRWIPELKSVSVKDIHDWMSITLRTHLNQ